MFSIERNNRECQQTLVSDITSVDNLGFSLLVVVDQHDVVAEGGRSRGAPGQQNGLETWNLETRSMSFARRDSVEVNN